MDTVMRVLIGALLGGAIAGAAYFMISKVVGERFNEKWRNRLIIAGVAIALASSRACSQ